MLFTALLPITDMAIYGEEPAIDSLSLVVCGQCGRVVKSQALLQHQSELLFYSSEKERERRENEREREREKEREREREREREGGRRGAGDRKMEGGGGTFCLGY